MVNTSSSDRNLTGSLCKASAEFFVFFHGGFEVVHYSWAQSTLAHIVRNSIGKQARNALARLARNFLQRGPFGLFYL